MDKEFKRLSIYKCFKSNVIVECKLPMNHVNDNIFKGSIVALNDGSIYTFTKSNFKLIEEINLPNELFPIY